jgi:hypothetical protein
MHAQTSWQMCWISCHCNLGWTLASITLHIGGLLDSESAYQVKLQQKVRMANCHRCAIKVLFKFWNLVYTVTTKGGALQLSSRMKPTQFLQFTTVLWEDRSTGRSLASTLSLRRQIWCIWNIKIKSCLTTPIFLHPSTLSLHKSLSPQPTYCFCNHVSIGPPIHWVLANSLLTSKPVLPSMKPPCLKWSSQTTALSAALNDRIQNWYPLGPQILVLVIKLVMPYNAY